MLKLSSKIVLFTTLPIVILLMSFSFCVFNIDYFDMKFEENNIEEVTGIKHEKLLDISEEMLKYLSDERENLIIYEEVSGERVQIFEGIELDHMQDVKVLFDYGFFIRNSLLVILVFSIIYLFFKDKRSLIKVSLISSIAGIILIAIIGLFMINDFNGAFVIFHKILFSNDLWILNPDTDILIQMLPENFFMDLGYIILKVYVICLASISVISLILLNKIKFIKQ